MKANKNLLVLALVLALATSMVAPLVAQANGGMVLVQGGTFTMGNTTPSEKTIHAEEFPAHKVTVSSFYVSEQPITLEQWMYEIDKYPTGYTERASNKYVHRNQWKLTAAANITWFDVLTYCNRRSLTEGLTPCYASNGSTDAVTNPNISETKRICPTSPATGTPTATGYPPKRNGNMQREKVC